MGLFSTLGLGSFSNYVVTCGSRNFVFLFCFEGGEEEKGQGYVTEPRRGFQEEYKGGRGSTEEDVFGYGPKGFSGEGRRDIREDYGRGRESEEDVFGYGAQGGVSRDVGEEELYGGGGRRNERYAQEQGAGAGGVLGAIGETIAEIAENTKKIVIGDPPERTHEHGTAGYMGQEHGRR